MANQPKRQHGGARAGAGRPKNTPQLLQTLPSTNDPKAFLLALMNDLEADIKLRADAAKTLLPFMHQRQADVGIKDEKLEAAKKAGAGKYGAGRPPVRLVSQQ